MSFCSYVVVEYSRLHMCSNHLRKVSHTPGMLHTFFGLGAVRKTMCRAKSISGVIPLCSATCVFHTFFQQFKLTSKLWPKVRKRCTHSNSSNIILTKVTTGTNTKTHWLHVFIPNHLYSRDTNASSRLRIDLGTDTLGSHFISDHWGPIGQWQLQFPALWARQIHFNYN